MGQRPVATHHWRQTRRVAVRGLGRGLGIAQHFCHHSTVGTTGHPRQHRRASGRAITATGNAIHVAAITATGHATHVAAITATHVAAITATGHATYVAAITATGHATHVAAITATGHAIHVAAIAATTTAAGLWANLTDLCSNLPNICCPQRTARKKTPIHVSGFTDVRPSFTDVRPSFTDVRPSFADVRPRVTNTPGFLISSCNSTCTCQKDSVVQKTALTLRGIQNLSGRRCCSHRDRKVSPASKKTQSLLPDLSGLLPDLSGLLPGLSGLLPGLSGLLPGLSGSRNIICSLFNNHCKSIYWETPS